MLHDWQRGLHNVGDEIRFSSWPGFVFHDSRGFEAGSIDELVKVRQFVEDSSAATKISRQLHAIWSAHSSFIVFCKLTRDKQIRLCLPLDEARDLFDSEKEIFNWSRGQSKLKKNRYEILT